MNEIDYDRLAESIVRAQQYLNQQNQDRKRHVFFRSFVMKVLNFAVYSLIVCAAIASSYVLWHFVIQRGYLSEKWGYALTGMLMIVAVFAFLCLIEALFDQTDDARSYFSINLSLIALMLSFINLASRFIDF